MDRELIRNCCRNAYGVHDLLKSLNMDELCGQLAVLQITDLSSLSQVNESDLRRLGLKTGPRKKISEVVRILKTELKNNQITTNNNALRSVKEENKGNTLITCKSNESTLNSSHLASEDLFILDKEKKKVDYQKRSKKDALGLHTNKQLQRENKTTETVGRNRGNPSSSQVSNQGKSSSTDMKYDAHKMLALSNVTTRSLRERIANKENIHIPTSIPLNNNCTSESNKDISKVENQIAYLAQINYGGAPRGMYNHFYDGIRMAGQNSPHAILSPQFVTGFPPFPQPLCFTGAPQVDSDQVQYNGSPLVFYPSTLVNFDFRLTPSSMLTANNMTPFTNEQIPDTLHSAPQSATYHTVQNGMFQSSTGQTPSTFNAFNATQETQRFPYKNIRSGDSCDYYSSVTELSSSKNLHSDDGHAACICEKEAGVRWDLNTHPCHSENADQPTKNSKNVQAGSNQYFKAESGKLLPRRL